LFTCSLISCNSSIESRDLVLDRYWTRMMGVLIRCRPFWSLHRSKSVFLLPYNHLNFLFFIFCLFPHCRCPLPRPWKRLALLFFSFR
jgi:hypothetical protein